MMRLGLSESLPSLVAAKFRTAQSSNSLIFTSSELAIIHTSTDVPFQLRFCPSLAKKPTSHKGKEEDAQPAKKKVDPFDNPGPALHIADIPASNPTHLLVLNKFPIISEHFILATKRNVLQTHALEQDDLEATYACLRAWEDGGDDAGAGAQRRLFAFFNSGEHSGASQSHRHLQFLPVENMKAEGWDLLVDLILGGDCASGHDDVRSLKLPMIHLAHKFESEPSGPTLLHIYTTLYQRALEAVNKYIATNPGTFTLHSAEDGSSAISYNLAMTTSGMAILPRRAEGSMLRDREGKEIGFVALNGTTLGGTLMVKEQKMWDLLREKGKFLDGILGEIGFPVVGNEKVERARV